MAARAVKKTISLPADLARNLEEQARAERKTLSGIIQEGDAGGSGSNFINCRPIGAARPKRRVSFPSGISSAASVSANPNRYRNISPRGTTEAQRGRGPQ